MGHRVRQGHVVYIATEGAGSVENRILALRNTHLASAEDVKLTVLPVAVDLLDRDDQIQELIEDIRRLEGDTDEPVVLIIIDTLSQAMAGGDENGPKDMTTVVASVNRIRDALDSTVMLIHHTGKNEARGARGHSSLKAATDTELEVSGSDGLFRLKSTKQRDRGLDALDLYTLRTVHLGEDDEGDPIETCVIESAEGHSGSVSSVRLSAPQRLLKTCMGELFKAGRSVIPDSRTMVDWVEEQKLTASVFGNPDLFGAAVDRSDRRRRLPLELFRRSGAGNTSRRRSRGKGSRPWLRRSRRCGLVAKSSWPTKLQRLATTRST